MTLTADQASELQRATGDLLVRALDVGAISFLEVGIAARLAALVRQGDRLNTNNARQAWRILKRNEGRLADAGLTMPTAPGPAVVSVAAPVVRPAPPDRRHPRVGTREDGRIGVTDAPFALKEPFKAELHARWDPARKQWHVPATPTYAAALLAMLAAHGPVASERVTALAGEFASAAERRAVLDPSVPAPEFDTEPLVLRDLWEHQMRAVEYASTASASCLAMPMGSGKTAAAIAAANRAGAQRTIIVCPNKVRGVWPREIRKWSRAEWHIVDGRRPSRRKGGRPQDLKVPDRLEQAEACLFDCACGAAMHVATFNYEMLTHPLMAFRGEESPGWVPPVMLDLVIYDEVQKLKSPTGIIAKTAAQWVSYFHRRIGLSGTPMPQYPWDIFAVYRALDPGIFGPLWTPFKTEFVRQAVNKGTGREFSVSIIKSKREEFAIKVHSIMYRPTVDLQLPGAHHVVRRVELEPSAREQYNQLDSDEMLAELGDFTQVSDEVAVEDDQPILTPKNVLARTLRLRQFTGGFIPDDGDTVEVDGRIKKLRNLYRVSHAKAEALAEILEEIGCVKGREPEPEPVCVYAVFVPHLDAIREVAEAAGLRYAEISGRRSDGLTQESEMSPDADVVGIQVQSGGTGVDLTRSRYGVLYSADYSVGDHDQMLKRQDRPGQTRLVTFAHLVATDTVDEVVYRSLASRRSMTATFMRAKGLSPALLGLSDDDVAPEMSLDEVVEKFNADRLAEGVAGDDGRVGGVPLPIDDFVPDVLGDPRDGRRPSRRALTDEDLAEYDLEGFM